MLAQLKIQACDQWPSDGHCLSVNMPQKHPLQVHQSGLTLIELMVGVAVLAILIAMAVPSVTFLIDRARLTGATEALAQDLQVAKSESLRRNNSVSFSVTTGANWCYGMVVSTTACNCTTPGSCSLRRLASTDIPDVSIASSTFTSNAATFSAHRGLAQAGSIEFSHSRAGTLRVNLTALGQVSICAPNSAQYGFPACPVSP